MPSRKHAKPRLVPKHKGKGLSNLARFKGSDKKSAKQLPDTSRIPWFPPIPKTGTNA